MATSNQVQQRKHIHALIAALVMTLLMGLVMLAFSVNAVLNQNFSPLLQPSGASQIEFSTGNGNASNPELSDPAQSQIAAYQAREAQYQTELQNAAGTINQLSEQNQQYQNLFNALINAGVINITPDGQVTLPHTSYSRDD